MNVMYLYHCWITPLSSIASDTLGDIIFCSNLGFKLQFKPDLGSVKILEFKTIV